MSPGLRAFRVAILLHSAHSAKIRYSHTLSLPVPALLLKPLLFFVSSSALLKLHDILNSATHYRQWYRLPETDNHYFPNLRFHVGCEYRLNNYQDYLN